MAASSSVRASGARILGRLGLRRSANGLHGGGASRPAEDRLAAIERRLVAVETAVQSMQRTLETADPQMCRDVVDALSVSVAELMAAANVVLARDGLPGGQAGPAQG